MGFNITLESHHINQANSNLFIKLNYFEVGIEDRFSNKIIKELSVIYARIINQYTFKYQTIFPARFDNQDEKNQVLNETELLINLKINHNLKETDIHIIDIKSPLEHQIQIQEK